MRAWAICFITALMAVDGKETAKRGPQSQPQLSDTTQAQNYIALFLLTKIDGTHCTCVCELQKFKEFVRAGPAQNLRTGSNETRLFITILSSSTHDDLCNGIENIIVHISAHTPGDIFIWSLNNSAKYTSRANVLMSTPLKMAACISNL